MGGFDGLGGGTDGPRLGSSYASGAGNWDSSYEGNIAGEWISTIRSLCYDMGHGTLPTHLADAFSASSPSRAS